MQSINLLLMLFLLFVGGCWTEESEPVVTDSPNDEIHQEKAVIRKKPRFDSKDRLKSEIVGDFPKPIKTYPSIDAREVEVHAGGVLYRKNINRPFTGSVVERYEDGSVALESSYLDGLPHGQQLRRFKSGKPSLEAIFDQGVLSGIKSKWWENGNIREEEYWSEGKFYGRRLWDQTGRMIREELVQNP